MTNTKKLNYLKADITLLLLSIGFFISYPFHSSFAGGLIFSGCSAGMIGGLADWFAVNALFRKPLGIKPNRIIRTDIIARNRQRIFNALVEMVQNELLSKENLKIQLSQYNLSEAINEYLTLHKGQEELEELLITLSQDTMENIDPLILNKFVDGLLREGIENIKLAPLLAKIINFSLDKNYLEPLIDFLFKLLKVLVKHPQTNQVLIPLIQHAYDHYEGNNSARKIVSSFFPSSVDMAEIVQEKLLSLLDNPAIHLKLKSYLEYLGEELNINPALQEKIELAKERLVDNQNIYALITSYLSGFPRKISTENRSLALWFQKFIHNILNSLINFNLSNLDNLIKTKLNDWIDNKHDKIGGIVRDNLDQLSNETLIQLIEGKAGNDLQMIRINGSLTGGIVGILIYLMTYFIS
ncbi:MAG: DUF445 domain-containing protein [Desulfitobacteriaceae bacterium]|nr:DUF445 domain-containing protein [Desulfitobacteriaceae bacterium]MDD4346596.1 DUF445 domain-containing protein [Desulfitobacteriaceae bacterium]